MLLAASELILISLTLPHQRQQVGQEELEVRGAGVSEYSAPIGSVADHEASSLSLF